MNNQLNIFEFTNYKEYLTAWREAEKTRDPKLTHQKLCEKLGQTNRTYFNDIEKGRKNIGSQVLDDLIRLMKLEDDKAKYFRAIVGYGQPATSGEREYWFEQMIQLNHTPKYLVDKNTYTYYKKWYYTSLRAYLETCDFKDQYAEASRKLFSRVSSKDVKRAIKSLLTLGLISPNKEGFLKPTEKVLTSGNNVHDELMRQYHLANHDILRTILEKDEPGTHDSSQVTVSVSEFGMKRIIKRITQLRSEIMSIAHKDEAKATRVYKIAIHAYPETKKD
jgi:uncharacterized protein (TIGR02147 family)